MKELCRYKLTASEELAVYQSGKDMLYTVNVDGGPGHIASSMEECVDHVLPGLDPVMRLNLLLDINAKIRRALELSIVENGERIKELEMNES